MGTFTINHQSVPCSPNHHVKMNSSPARPATEATASASRAAEDTTAVRVEETSTANSMMHMVRDFARVRRAR
ncbi:hypothetical protein E4U12_005451 [Claviceps purpurea]|nr:hypothetical protein E4U12_005451 [Claviceps purpurea]KAG6321650.1 hypothetical protein E4U44_004677 [Claviceps purpurea]